MLDFTEIAPDLFSEKQFAVSLNGVSLFHIGFSRESLMTRRVYITLLPQPALRPLHLRGLRQLFNSLEPAIYYCQVKKSDTTGLRFAHFFGFTPYEELGDRVELIKENF